MSADAGSTNSSRLPPIPVEVAKVPLAKVQSPWTGLVGLVVLIAALLALATKSIATPGADASMLARSLWHHRFMAVLGLAVLAMAAIEIAIFRVHARHFDVAHPRVLDRAARGRVLRRWAGVLVMVVMAWGLYSIFHMYRFDRWLAALVGTIGFPDLKFVRFFEFLFAGSILVAVLGLPYFAWCERRARDVVADEADELQLAWEAGWRAFVLVPAAILTPVLRPLGLDLRPRISSWWKRLVVDVSRPELANLLRWGFVKFFFLPYMLVGYVGNCGLVDEHLAQAVRDFGSGRMDVASATRTYHALLNGLFLVDLAFATIGYAVTFKLLDTHVKSAEPTMLGWAVTLACYDPFNGTTNRFIAHGGDGQWLKSLGDGVVSQTVFVVWGATILVLLGIYVWATIVFGMRFSNLTNRGILCRGPYALIRHPAYASKNLAWWLMSVPFLRDWISTVGLLAWNLVYLVRAFTEERHLRADPHYREYCERVRWRFIPGLI